MKPSLGMVAWALGIWIIAVRGPGVVWPERYIRVSRRFPRHFLTGAVLAAIAAVWIAFYLYQGVTGTWSWLRPYAIAAVPVGYLVCLRYLDDYLAVRALAVLLLLIAKPMVDAARWHPSDLRLVVTVIAYLFVVVGMVLVVSPYRMRDMIDWAGRSPLRTRWVCAAGVGVGVVLCVLASTVYAS